MSRIGRHPVAIPAGVTVEIAEKNVVTVKGPKGTLVRELPVEMEIKKEGEEVIVTRPNDLKKMKSLHGLTRTLINNMVIGVTEGYEKVLEVNGVGYRASKSGNKLTLNLGYSHPVEMEDPEGIETVLDGQNKIIVKGISKEKVGQYAAEIRDKRRPEPYKGKGIKYADEVIRRKSIAPVLSATFNLLSCCIMQVNLLILLSKSNYLTFSTISTSLHLLSLDNGLVSITFTLSPILHSLFSSCAFSL